MPGSLRQWMHPASNGFVAGTSLRRICATSRLVEITAKVVGLGPAVWNAAVTSNGSGSGCSPRHAEATWSRTAASHQSSSSVR